MQIISTGQHMYEDFTEGFTVSGIVYEEVVNLFGGGATAVARAALMNQLVYMQEHPTRTKQVGEKCLFWGNCESIAPFLPEGTYYKYLDEFEKLSYIVRKSSNYGVYIWVDQDYVRREAFLASDQKNNKTPKKIKTSNRYYTEILTQLANPPDLILSKREMTLSKTEDSSLILREHLIYNKLYILFLYNEQIVNNLSCASGDDNLTNGKVGVAALQKIFRLVTGKSILTEELDKKFAKLSAVKIERLVEFLVITALGLWIIRAGGIDRCSKDPMTLLNKFLGYNNWDLTKEEMIVGAKVSTFGPRNKITKMGAERFCEFYNGHRNPAKTEELNIGEIYETYQRCGTEGAVEKGDPDPDPDAAWWGLQEE